MALPLIINETSFIRPAIGDGFPQPETLAKKEDQLIDIKEKLFFVPEIKS